jgi:O-antigen ligase
MTVLQVSATQRLGSGRSIGRLIVWLFTARLLIVGAEQFGLPEMSKPMAGAMLLLMVGLFLFDGRIARPIGMFAAGIVCWIGAAALSVLAGQVPDIAAAQALCLVLGFYLFFANVLWTCFSGDRGLDDLERMLRAFLHIGLLLCAVQLVTGTGFVDPGKPQIRRVFGADVHPVSFGLQLAVAMSGLAVIRLRQGKTVPRFLFLMGCIALYLTFARTAWVVFGLVLLGYAVFAGRWRTRLALFGALVFSGALLLGYSDRFDDLLSLPGFLRQFDFFDPVFDYRFVDNSFSWRLVNWAFGLKQASQAIWFGHGPGQSAVVSLFQLEMHNIFLEALFELGVPGLGAVCVTLCGLWQLHRCVPSARSVEQRGANAIIHAMGIGLLISVLISTSLVDQLTTVMLYLISLRAATIGQRQPVQT